METMKDPSVALVERKSVRISVVPGATIEEARGVRSVHADTSTTLMIFSFDDQFIGFSGSLGPSQKTTLGSSIVVEVDMVFSFSVWVGVLIESSTVQMVPDSSWHQIVTQGLDLLYAGAS